MIFGLLFNSLNGKIYDGFIPQGILSQSTPLTEKFFKEIKIGMYQLNDPNQNYFPTRWGTLMHFRGSDNYGAMIIISTFGATFVRHYALAEGGNWYTDWKQLAESTSS